MGNKSRKIGASRGVVGVGIAIALAVTSLGATGSAMADPSPTAQLRDLQSGYALAVPGSVLTAGASGSTSLSQAQLAAISANAAKFHFEFQTLNPSVPSEAATIATLQAELAVPATAETALVAGTVSNPAGAILIGGTAAVILTANVEKMMGVFDEGDICNSPPGEVYTAVDSTLATMTFTDCDEWQLQQDYVANANLDVPLVANFAIGSRSCIGTVCAVVSSGPVKSYWASNGQFTGYWKYCLTSTVANAFSHVPLVTSVSPPTLNPSTWAGGAEWGSSPTRYTDCPAVSGAQSYASISAGSAAGPIYTAWRANASSTEISVGGSPIRPDAVRNFVCTVTFVGGGSISRTSPAGQAGTGMFFKPECPAIPSNKVPARTQISLTSPTEGSTLIFDQATTAAYQAWKQNFPECGSGMCLLDLRSNGVSCFYEIVNCEGWFSDANRDVTYTCWYGTHAVALSECYVYSPTFYTTEVLNGNAYADPATGEVPPGKTSPSSLELVSESLYERIAGSTQSDLSGRRSWVSMPATDRRKYAFQIAKQCIGSAGSNAEMCKSKAIWVPGMNVHEVATHDLEAIAAGQPFALTYVSGADKQGGTYQNSDGSPGSALSRGWYGSAVLVPGSPCLGPAPSGKACDEYPYYSTAESSLLGNLSYVDGGQNSNEGSLRRAMLYSGCGIQAATAAEDRQFLVVPLPQLPVTVALCRRIG